MVNFGRLDSYIQIYTLKTSTAQTRDAYGAQTLTYSTSPINAYAMIVPGAGGEMVAGAAVNSEVTHTITIRHSTAVTPKAYLKFGSRKMDIKAVQDLEEQGRWLVLSCVEAGIQ